MKAYRQGFVGIASLVTGGDPARWRADGGRRGHFSAWPSRRSRGFDTAPTALLRAYGDALPRRYAKASRRYRFRSAAAKVDFVLTDDIPWLDPGCGGRRPFISAAPARRWR
jgi:hypothetical protein